MQLIASNLMAILSSIAVSDNSTNIVNDELSRGGISGKPPVNFQEKDAKIEERNKILLQTQQDLSDLNLSHSERCTKRDLEAQLDELRKDLENEKELRQKAERARRDLSNELESLKTEYVEATDKSAISLEIQKQKDDQLRELQASVDRERIKYEKNIEDCKQAET
ncbi:myosin tail domain-containing protein [Ditylenchus destructor]|uniref:Myosin tail domain-containing protein n=1 Tax=Ditylenchus destructor TaxID=166010 RepID=A0AAD4MKH1_9BILA|nr:myosin tail domain-containing protein [Ditylenchus destructor]